MLLEPVALALRARTCMGLVGAQRGSGGPSSPAPGGAAAAPAAGPASGSRISAGAVVQTMSADGYAGVLKGRSWLWARRSAEKSCSRVDTSTVRSSCCACARFKLSLRDLVEMMAERGLSLTHTTIMRWVQHYTPELEKRWHRHALAVGRSWR